MNKMFYGDCVESMQKMISDGVKAQMCVTSPPYFCLRDYGVDGQIGIEKTPEEYISRLVKVFQTVREVLSDDATLWLNLGDSYGKGKQLLGLPWRVAFALQSDGWVLRQDIIWNKPNAMPESVKDRCTKSHEYIFLLSKNKKYFIEPDGMREDSIKYKITGPREKTQPAGLRSDEAKKLGSFQMQVTKNRNRRSVWTIPTRPYKGAHCAVFPPSLIEPCILAGSRPGDIVLDPFMGSGTTAQVALQHGRQYIGCELNQEYEPLIDERIRNIVDETK